MLSDVLKHLEVLHCTDLWGRLKALSYALKREEEEEEDAC